ncbi:MAG: hypothetical protein VKJ24_20930, partial [Synechococcales bacterium]|nr:hypothetical protein [Synechococcales bacterium]
MSTNRDPASPFHPAPIATTSGGIESSISESNAIAISTHSLHQACWIEGISRSGKTTALVESLHQTIQQFSAQRRSTALTTHPGGISGIPGILVLAAIGDNRLELSDRITQVTQASYPCHTTTPLGFFEQEVTLFWSLLIQKLDLAAQFPLRLRPENEQELATRLWQPQLEPIVGQHQIRIYRLVRRLLDILQLAALSGVDPLAIPSIMTEGLEPSATFPLSLDQMGELLQQWRTWCLARGLLTYSLITELYGQQLLSDPLYQLKLRSRYAALFADDVDEYPALCQSLFQLFLDQGAAAAFTFNPAGAIRLGLGADPEAWSGLRHRCQVVELSPWEPSVRDVAGEEMVELITSPIFFRSLPDCIQTLHTTTRAQLLRQMTDLIVAAVQSEQVEPRQIAIVAPGLDAIARHTLVTILSHHEIPVDLLNEQRSLTSLPLIRSLLTLVALVYPQLGRLLSREAIAEMLTILTSYHPHWTAIDPVRAGLLADHCFVPHPDHPSLLPSQTFPRWDRLGYQVSTTYEQLLQWLADQQQQLAQRLISSPVMLLDRAIQWFFLG